MYTDTEPTVTMYRQFHPQPDRGSGFVPPHQRAVDVN